jgi:hypothetical protein
MNPESQSLLEAGEISGNEQDALHLQLHAPACTHLNALPKSQQALQQLEDAVQSSLGPQETDFGSPTASLANRTVNMP